jgi:hypothetical protein
MAKDTNSTKVVGLLIEVANSDTLYRDLYLRRERELAIPVLALIPLIASNSERAYAMGLTGISFSFIVSPVLINLGYKLVEHFKTETKPNQPLKALSESIHDQVVVIGYSYVGRVICIMLERANIPFIAFERSLERIAEAKKDKRKVYFGDVTNPAMMNALAISRARAVVVTTRDYSAVKRLIGNLEHFHPNVKVMTAVPYLFQRDELR